jgi:hypothetical protein
VRQFIRSRFLVAIVLALMTFTTVNCGFILYPERRGNMPGDVDGVVLVMDCLWLLVGVVPGVVALVVDFTTGSIYFGGHGKRRRYHHEIRIEEDSLGVHPGDRIAFNLAGPAPANAEVDVTLAPKSDKSKTVTLFDRKYSKDEKSMNIVMLSIPKKLEPGIYRIEVDVNGFESSSLDLNVTL